jgi:hypothetical protein
MLLGPVAHLGSTRIKAGRSAFADCIADPIRSDPRCRVSGSE